MLIRTLTLIVLLVANVGLITQAYSVQSELPRANLVEAMQQYNAGEYHASYRSFEELSQLGNSQVSAHLGIMILGAEGTDYDPVKAWAYFELAGEQGYSDGHAFAQEVYDQLTTEQQTSTAQALDELKANLIVNHEYDLPDEARAADLVPLERPAVNYPRRSAERRRLGFANTRFLIDTDGSVSTIDTHFYSHRDFKIATERAIQSWRYEPVAVPAATTVSINFTIAGRAQQDLVPYFEFIHESLWESAMAGNPSSQATLGFVLRAISNHSDEREIDEERVSSDPPTFEEFQAPENLAAFPVNWTGKYWLTLAAQAGDYSAQGSLAFSDPQWRDYLLGKKDEPTMAWEAVRLLQREDGHEQGRALIAQLEDSESNVVQNILRTIKPYYQQ